MANTNKDLPTQERVNYEQGYPVAAGAVLYRGAALGSVVAANVRYARAWQAGDLIIGVAQDAVDNSGGANGAKSIRVRRGCFKFQQNATITESHVDAYAKLVDDQTVAIEATPTTQTSSTLGRVTQVDADGVWVETRRYLP